METFEKQQNQEAVFTAWGTEVDGERGLAAAPAAKRAEFTYVRIIQAYRTCQ